MLENLTELLLPALLLLAGAVGIAKKQDVYGGMLTGAQDGLRLMLSLIPTLILMMTAVTMLRESGFFALLTPVFTPVMLGSSETTFYTISVYFGAAGVRKTRYALPAALIADLTGFCMAALSVRLFFR